MHERIEVVAKSFVKHVEAKRVSYCNPLPEDFATYEDCITNLTNQGSGPAVLTTPGFDVNDYLNQLKAQVLTNHPQCGPWDQQVVQGDDAAAEASWIVQPFVCKADKAYRAPGVRPSILLENVEDRPQSEREYRQFYDDWKFGKSPLYAFLEAMLDLRPNFDIRTEGQSTFYRHQVFAGGIVEGVLFEQSIHVISAYVKVTAETLASQGVGATSSSCASSQFEIYFALKTKVFYSEASFTLPGCAPAYQTCNPIFKPLGYTDDSLSYELLFFHKKWDVPFELGSFDIEVAIRAAGTAKKKVN